MLFTLIVPALVAVAGAVPQGINFDLVNKAPAATISGPSFGAITQTAVYDGDAAASSAAAAAYTAPPQQKRAELQVRDVNDPCAPQPGGYGPVAQPNTPSGFSNYPVFSAFANAAAPPIGYNKSFTNLNGSTQQNNYMGLYTLQTYNVTQCASICNSVSGCMAFNLYFERDPTLNPAPQCPNPPAQTDIKCTLWGSAVTAASATNTGQYREQFVVLIAGSDGFSRIPLSNPVPFFNTAVQLAGAIDSKAEYLGAKYYNSVYDPQVCAAVCTATTANNRAVAKSRYAFGGSASYQACNYFNSYVLKQNNVPTGLYCSYYTTPIESSKATVTVQTYGGVSYAVDNSFSYTLSVQDTGSVSS